MCLCDPLEPADCRAGPVTPTPGRGQRPRSANLSRADCFHTRAASCFSLDHSLLRRRYRFRLQRTLFRRRIILEGGRQADQEHERDRRPQRKVPGYGHRHCRENGSYEKGSPQLRDHPSPVQMSVPCAFRTGDRRSEERKAEMASYPAQRSGHERQAHRLPANLGQHRIDHAHGEAQQGHIDLRVRALAADQRDRDQQDGDEKENKPGRVTPPYMGNDDSGCASRDKTHNRDCRNERGRELPLTGSHPGHGRVAAHEGDISPQNQQAVAVEVPRRERHAGAQRLLDTFFCRNCVGHASCPVSR